MARGPERKGAILTKQQRDFLEENAEATGDSARDTRRRIRRRVRDSLWDIPFLAEHLPGDDLKQVVYEKEDPANPASPEYEEMALLLNVVPGIIELLFRCRPDPVSFEDYIEEGILTALNKEGWDAQVNVQIDIEKTPISEIADKLEAQGVAALDEREIGSLLTSGEIDSQRYHELRIEYHNHLIEDAHEE